MTSPAWENLDDFLSQDDFATEARFTPKGGQAGAPVSAIFDEPYFNADLGEYDMNLSDPRLTCKASDVAGLKRHDGCTIAAQPGVAYELIDDPKPDGTGMAAVKLARVYD